jgi:hypothetical protein
MKLRHWVGVIGQGGQKGVNRRGAGAGCQSRGRAGRVAARWRKCGNRAAISEGEAGQIRR